MTVAFLVSVIVRHYCTVSFLCGIVRLFQICPKKNVFSVSSYTSHFSIPANFKGTSSVNVSDVSCLKELAQGQCEFLSYHTILLTLPKKNRNTCEHLKLLPLETF